jgi:hypothetical protein
VDAGSVLSESVAWVRRNWIRTLIFSVASFVVCWLWNIWLVARAANGGGFADVGKTGSVATAPGSDRFNGLYWLLISTIGFGLFTYGRERGFANAIADIAGLPGSLAKAVTSHPTAAWAMLLWGMAAGLSLGGFMPNAVSATLGAGFVLLALTPVAAIVNNVIIRLFTGIVSSAAPNVTALLAGLAAPFLVMMGEVAGLVFTNLAGLEVLPSLVLAVACGVGAYLFGAAAGKAGPAIGPVAFMFVLLVGLASVGGLAARPAAADDGGWSECVDAKTGKPCRGLSGIRLWWKSPGASVARNEARAGGLYGGAGAVFGAGLGGALGASAKRKGGWHLPGGGFGTHPVAFEGPDATRLLRDRGVIEPAEEGLFRWVGVDGPDGASSALLGSLLGGGRAVRVAVTAKPDADGLVGGDTVRVDAEVLDPSESSTQAAKKLDGDAADGAASGLADMPIEDVLPAEDRFDKTERATGKAGGTAKKRAGAERAAPAAKRPAKAAPAATPPAKAAPAAKRPAKAAPAARPPAKAAPSTTRPAKAAPSATPPGGRKAAGEAAPSRAPRRGATAGRADMPIEDVLPAEDRFDDEEQ